MRGHVELPASIARSCRTPNIRPSMCGHAELPASHFQCAVMQNSQHPLFIARSCRTPSIPLSMRGNEELPTSQHRRCNHCNITIAFSTFHIPHSTFHIQLSISSLYFRTGKVRRVGTEELDFTVSMHFGHDPPFTCHLGSARPK
jgi:hypothetical protein